MDSNEFKKRIVAGEYRDIEVDPDGAGQNVDQIGAAVDRLVVWKLAESLKSCFCWISGRWSIPNTTGKPDENEIRPELSCHVVTLDENTGQVLKICRNYNEDDKYKCRKVFCIVLVEGPGAYGLGFVHLIGGLSKTATAALRQLLDAGTLSNLPAGFKAKGARIADDNNPIQPGEWRDIDAGGAELSGSLLPMPYKEPSQPFLP